MTISLKVGDYFRYDHEDKDSYPHWKIVDITGEWVTGCRMGQDYRGDPRMDSSSAKFSDFDNGVAHALEAYRMETLYAYVGLDSGKIHLLDFIDECHLMDTYRCIGKLNITHNKEKIISVDIINK